MEDEPSFKETLEADEHNIKTSLQILEELAPSALPALDVRPNHFALHEFVAAADWQGWEAEILPPQGWRCRCGVVEVPWHVAAARGWSGTFPLGTAKLDEFRRLGGADEGFPRDLFVVGVGAAVAA